MYAIFFILCPMNGKDTALIRAVCGMSHTLPVISPTCICQIILVNDRKLNILTTRSIISVSKRQRLGRCAPLSGITGEGEKLSAVSEHIVGTPLLDSHILFYSSHCCIRLYVA